MVKDLSNLRFDKFDSFYENSEFKQIIEKINQNSNFNDSLETIANKTNTLYWFALENLQRKLFVFVFIVAALQLSEVFIMTVFTVLANISNDISKA